LTQVTALNSGHFHAAVGITEVLADVKQTLLDEKDHMLEDPTADSLDLELGEKMGSGGFGEVFRGRFRGVRWAGGRCSAATWAACVECAQHVRALLSCTPTDAGSTRRKTWRSRS